MAQMDGLLRFYFKCDFDNISDEKYAELQAKLEWILIQRGDMKYE